MGRNELILLRKRRRKIGVAALIVVSAALTSVFVAMYCGGYYIHRVPPHECVMYPLVGPGDIVLLQSDPDLGDLNSGMIIGVFENSVGRRELVLRILAGLPGDIMVWSGRRRIDCNGISCSGISQELYDAVAAKRQCEVPAERVFIAARDFRNERGRYLGGLIPFSGIRARYVCTLTTVFRTDHRPVF